MTQKSNIAFGERPDWYRNFKTHRRGDYFGSLSSIWPGELFVTHDLMYQVHHDSNGTVLVNRNACAHAGAPLIEIPGEYSLEEIRCPVHQWLYKPNGQLIFAPRFKSCENIKLSPAEFGIWNGYIIGYSQEELDVALKDFGAELGLPTKCFDPREFEYVDEIVDEDAQYPREIMMINYFDGYHVPLCHPTTFDSVTDCNTYAWELSPEHQNHRLGYSIQQVRSRKNVQKHVDGLKSVSKFATKVFGWADLHFWLRDKLPSIQTPIDPDIFAVWGAIYGNGHLMLELYEGGLFLAVSSLVNTDPKNPDTANKNPVEYYVHKSIPEGLRDVAKRKFIDAYKQSADEDTEICKKLWQSHRLGNMEFSRIYHETLEKGDLHWREWYKNHYAIKD